MLLPFNLIPQFLFGRHIEHVFGGKKPVVIMQYGIAGNIIIGFGTQQDADGRIISLATHPLILDAHIHIHLSHVLMRYRGCFQVDKDKILEDIIVKHKVDEIVFLFGTD